jgi:hypothetical protein
MAEQEAERIVMSSCVLPGEITIEKHPSTAMDVFL